MISLLLPTRQRPSGVQRLAESIAATAADPAHVELVLFVDDDDTSYDDMETLPIGWHLLRGPRADENGLVNLSRKWNACLEVAFGKLIMHCGDDIVFRTPGWDDVVRSAFSATPDNILFAYGRDGIQGPDFGTHGFIHRAWIEAVGYLFPPLFVSDYNDTFLNDVAKRIGRHHLLDVYTEHMHYIAGKAEVDRNTAERLARHQQCKPDLLYASPDVQQMIIDAAERLKGAMND